MMMMMMIKVTFKHYFSYYKPCC